MSLPTRFDLNLLRVFDAIYTAGGVSAAARALSLSQPAISHALARLRDACNDPLFVRAGATLVPTAFARGIANVVRTALHNADVALRPATFDPATGTQRFRIGMRLSTEASHFAGIAARVMDRAAHVQLASVRFNRRELPSALAQGLIDVAIDVPQPECASVQSVVLGSNHMVVAMRAGHPHCRSGLTRERYLQSGHVLATPRANGLALVDQALIGVAAEGRRIVVRCQQLPSAWQMVATSDLLLTLPQIHADALANGNGNRTLPLPVLMPAMQLRLFWHVAAEADAAQRWLRSVIVDSFVESEGAGVIRPANRVNAKPPFRRPSAADYPASISQ